VALAQRQRGISILEGMGMKLHEVLQALELRCRCTYNRLSNAQIDMSIGHDELVGRRDLLFGNEHLLDDENFDDKPA
jgi:hypothetical protein